MNLKGLNVLNNLKTFRNLREEELLPPPIYLVNKFWKSKIEHITIIISILFQLSLKYEPSSRAIPIAIILKRASNKNIMLKIASTISNIRRWKNR